MTTDKRWCKEHKQPAFLDRSKYGIRKGFACSEGHNDWLQGAGLLCDIDYYEEKGNEEQDDD